MSLFEPSVPANLEFKQTLLQLEDQLAKGPKLTFETTHHFLPGLYTREFFQSKGVVLTSKIHRHPYMLVLAQGRVVMHTELGRQVFEAPAVMPCFPGVKRVLLALEDCTYVSCHPTDETDLNKIEDDLIVADLDEWAMCASPVQQAVDWSDMPILEEGDDE